MLDKISNYLNKKHYSNAINFVQHDEILSYIVNIEERIIAKSHLELTYPLYKQRNDFINLFNSNYNLNDIYILSAGPSIDEYKNLLPFLKDKFVIAVGEWAMTSEVIFPVYMINHIHAHYIRCMNESKDNMKTIINNEEIIKVIGCENINTIENRLGFSFPNTNIFTTNTNIVNQKIKNIGIEGTGPGTTTRCALDLALYFNCKNAYIFGFDLEVTDKIYNKYVTKYIPELKIKELLNKQHKYFFSNEESSIYHENCWKQRFKLFEEHGKQFYSVSKKCPYSWDWFPKIDIKDIV